MSSKIEEISKKDVKDLMPTFLSELVTIVGAVAVVT